jgi:hypothetical protein
MPEICKMPNLCNMFSTSVTSHDKSSSLHFSPHTFLLDSLLSYFKIVFSVLTGFSVNFTLGKQAVGIYSGIYKDMHRSKGNMSTEVFDCEKIETDIVCNIQWSQNNGT